MTNEYRVAGISEVVGAPVLTSRFAREIAEPHRPFFGGRTALATSDLREKLVPPIGPTITEPGLAERWDAYDDAYRSEARISRFWAVELEEATVFPPYGIVAVGGQLVRDTIRNWKLLQSVFPAGDARELRKAMDSTEARIAAPAVPPAYRVAGHSCLLGSGLADNYFNWTLRYASGVAHYQALPEVSQLVAPPPRKAYVADTLEFMGVPQHQVVHLEAPMIFERLTLVSPMAFGRYEISPLIVPNLREHPRVTELWRRPGRRLYIPRRKVRMRKVVNEPLVEAALKRLGFEVFDNATRGVREQVHAFRDASIVVAPHGAGLSNIVYCDEGTPVVEVVPEGYDQGVTSYRSLSDMFGLRYTQLFAREAAPDRKGNRCNADIELDIAELIRVIEGLLP
ncbi:MAG: hypothetical protein JWR10_3311 [Rubritepida sp.]|nr:hypothetical protein [Rubritepida sp.]